MRSRVRCGPVVLSGCASAAVIRRAAVRMVPGVRAARNGTSAPLVAVPIRIAVPAVRFVMVYVICCVRASCSVAHGPAVTMFVIA